MQQRLDRLSEKDKNGRRLRARESRRQLFRRSQVVENLSIATYLESIIPLGGAPVGEDARGYRHYRSLRARLPKPAQSWSSLFSMPLTVSHRGFDDRETGELCFVLSRLTLALRSVLLD